MNVYHFGCTATWSEGPPSDLPKTEEEALAHIDELYQSGVPFFTKEMMRSAMKEIRRPLTNKDKVHLKDMNGAVVAYQMDLGNIEEFPNSDDSKRELEYLLTSAVIEYNCRAEMRHSIFWQGYDPKIPYFCPLSISNNASVRDKATKEMVAFPAALPDEVSGYFKEDLDAWNKTEMCSNVKRILNSAAKHLEIKKVVAVSLDSVSRYREWEREWKQEGRNGYQHGLALTLRDWVKEKNSGADVPCFLQDPAYLDPDKEVLPEYGFQIVDDPEAWLEMDDFSVVISISSNVPTKEIIADLARPAVVICDRIDNEDYDKRCGGSV
ncbi:uncharacterized protein N7483_010369 [Penicillium malachiteum]|uniref:uncharacterized protein n=1 Tax=Penicillium malachiteum TaxID=1324776 RepID=UPI002548EDD1|nr:uncharacterized protein N7483_010369 [Penicillium malachiteum]KAJ5713188.1 hypothetical protein N7483_010369 [Penicillium malachiteum]